YFVYFSFSILVFADYFSKLIIYSDSYSSFFQIYFFKISQNSAKNSSYSISYFSNLLFELISYQFYQLILKIPLFCSFCYYFYDLILFYLIFSSYIYSDEDIIIQCYSQLIF
ncbi:hypothetical protein IMG5_115000, partial [Ichthyophthirius multifiliis]